jgi:hypothetical protein
MRQINLKFKRAIFLFMVAFASICNYAHAQVATITSFNPLAARPGDGLTIIGTNFNTTAANNIVYFGTVRASVAAATATSLVVSVPDGAIYILLLFKTVVLVYHLVVGQVLSLFIALPKMR